LACASCIVCTLPAFAEESSPLILNGIRFVADPSLIALGGIEIQQTIEADSFPLFQTQEFNHAMENFFGRTLNEELLAALIGEVRNYCLGHNQPFMDIASPEQDVTNGNLQLLVIQGRLGKIHVQNNNWFSEELLKSEMGLSPNAPIDQSQVLQNLDWINRNPFRSVNLIYERGDQLGETDLTLRVDDKFPLKGFAGYNNYGNRFTGFTRFFAGMTWGNVFGLDHILSYQYTTDANLRKLQSHTLDYTIPLPWRHLFTVYGAYESSKPNVHPDFKMHGVFWQASMRYVIPLPLFDRYRHELHTGYDFKTVTNNIFFDVLQISHTKYQISQFSADYDLANQDAWGDTNFTLTVYGSPGHMGSHNNNKTFEKFREGAKAAYCYLRGAFERTINFAQNWKYVCRLAGQGSFQRLMVSEQFGIGGYNTVRGFEEREANGDHGWFTNQEIHSPSVSFVKKKDGSHKRDAFYVLAFGDAGQVFNHKPPEGENSYSTLISAGLGVRYTFQQNAFVRIDYGYPIRNSSIKPHTKIPQRVNVMASVGF
jgi:hemolysin activation/secretion protein